MSTYIEFRKNKHYDSRIVPPEAADPKELFPKPFQFFLELRVNLYKLNPKNGKKTDVVYDSDGNPTTIQCWDAASWLYFRRRYMKLVTQVWDKAFLLLPPKGYDGFTWPASKGSRRDLLCRLSVKLRDNPSLAHVSIPVIRVVPSLLGFRDDAGHYASDMQEPWARSFSGKNFKGNTPAHEVGHLLGLIKHINAHDPDCKTNAESVCYGSNLAERMNIMGSGSKLALFNAKPWQRRIHSHAPPTHYDDWTPSWASVDAILRGDGDRMIDEQIPKPPVNYRPGLIDL